MCQGLWELNSPKRRWNTPCNGHSDTEQHEEVIPSIQKCNSTTQINNYLHNGTVIDPAIKPTPI